MVAVALGGLAVLTVLLIQGPFHEDEAIYAVWSLALPSDPLLLDVAVDKPPLTFYPIAASIALFGRHEWAARLPAVLWSLLLLAALARIARREGGSPLVAVGLAIASPLFWAMGLSAFTDMAMVALTFAAVERLLAGRTEVGGVLFALAILAKPTALLLAPLALLAARRGRPESGPVFVAAAAGPLLLAWAWDAARDAPSWWWAGAGAYGTLGRPTTALAPWGVAVGITIAIPFVAVLALILEEKAPSNLSAWRRAWEGALLLTIAAWLPLHLLLGFQPWPRYLLPLVPLVALLGARLWKQIGRRSALTLISLLFLGPLLTIYLNVEPHDTAWNGIGGIGSEIERLPAGAVVYYTREGRPLAWYAAESRAELRWAGAGPDVAGALAARPDDSYLVVGPHLAGRPLPDGALVALQGRFRLVALDPVRAP